MGLILDSTVVIAGERRGHTVRQILEQFQAAHGITIAFEDLLIAATALHLGFAVATSNV